MSKKFLFIYRNPAAADTKPPSPAEMQQMLATWGAWKAKFSAEVVDLGDGLHPTGKVLTSAGVTDGPLVESKELVGGYSVVQAKSYEDALRVARECPLMSMPHARIEVRELMGF